MQCIGYNILSEPKFLMRSLSMAGAVLLILAETRTSTHTVFDLPTLGGDKPKVHFYPLLVDAYTLRSNANVFSELPSTIGKNHAHSYVR